MSTKIVSYDQNNDILVIHKGFSSDETFKGNIDIGELILDVSTAGRIRGLEIMNASHFLEELAIKTEILEHLEDARFSADIKPNSIILTIILKSKECEVPAKVAVPLETPLFH